MFRRRSRSRKEVSMKDVIKKLLDFLSSPVWALPIATFIEQRSLVFDRAYGELITQEYKKVHSEYAQLVATLFECFCDDTGISNDQLRDGLRSLDTQRLNMKQKTALEPVAAASDFEVFVPMMMRKNVELQLQALQMIEFMCGAIPAVLQLQEGETLQDKKSLSAEDTERYVLFAVMRQSKEEFDSRNAAELREDLELLAQHSEQERLRLQEALEKEEQLGYRSMDHRPLELLPAPLQNDREKGEAKEEKPASSQAIRPTTRSTSEKRTPTAAVRPPTTQRRKLSMGRPLEVKANNQKEIEPVKTPEPAITTKNGPENKTENDVKTKLTLRDIRRSSLKKQDAEVEQEPESPGTEHGPRRKNVNDVNALLQEPSRLNSSDVASRRKYLEEQRDKLMAMKRAEREKQLQEISTRVSQERPRTAKAARGAMRGVGEETIAARKALAEKLKKEFVTE